MTQSEYHQATKRLFDRCFAIQNAKRREYTGESEDVLLNFKEQASYLRTTPDVVWGVFFMKGLKSITVLMRDAFTGALTKSAEPPLDRFADAVNYLLLAYALWAERTTQNQQPIRADLMDARARAVEAAQQRQPFQPEQTSPLDMSRPRLVQSRQRSEGLVDPGSDWPRSEQLPRDRSDDRGEPEPHRS